MHLIVQFRNFVVRRRLAELFLSRSTGAHMYARSFQISVHNLDGMVMNALFKAFVRHDLLPQRLLLCPFSLYNCIVMCSCCLRKALSSFSCDYASNVALYASQMI